MKFFFLIPKNIKYILFLIFFVNVCYCYSQSDTTNKSDNQSGIYLTGTDFINNILSYKGICDTQNKEYYIYNKRKDKSYKIINKKDTTIINFSDAWGFRDCELINIRYYNGAFYKVLEKGTAIIYQRPVHQYHASIFFIINFYEVKHFYYSVAADSEIYKIKKRYLKKSYVNNPKFISLLKNDNSSKELYEYDRKNKKYYLNYLLEKSK